MDHAHLTGPHRETERRASASGNVVGAAYSCTAVRGRARIKYGRREHWNEERHLGAGLVAVVDREEHLGEELCGALLGVPMPGGSSRAAIVGFSAAIGSLSHTVAVTPPGLLYAQ